MTIRDTGVQVPINNNGIYPNQTLQTYNGGNMMNVPGEYGPKLLETGLGEESLPVLEGKYNYDVHEIAVKMSKDSFPIKFMMDLNTKSIDKDTHLYGEDWDGDNAFPDTFMNDLRLRNNAKYDIDSSNNIGGNFSWKAMDAGLLAKLNTIVGGGDAQSIAKVIDETTQKHQDTMVTFNGKLVIPIAFKAGTSELFQGGDSVRFVQKAIQILSSNDYKLRGGNGTVVPLKQSGVAKDFYLLTHEGTEAKAVHSMFPDLAISIDEITHEEHEINARVEGFLFAADCTEFILLINFTQSNLKNNLGTTNVVLLDEMINDSNTTAEFYEPGFYTRLDRQLLVGMYNNIADGVEEGSGSRRDGYSIWQYGSEIKTNFVQIFRSKPLEITKTRLAGGGFRVDDIQKHRKTMTDQFNTTKSNTFLWGKKERKLGKNGRPFKTMSGLFDYELNQIRYIRATLPMSVSNASEAIETWINNLAYSFSAFKEKKGSKVITFATSYQILRKLDKFVKLSRQQTPNLFGTDINRADVNKSTVDFSVAYFDFVSSYGITIRFIHAPEFDYMTEFPLPYFIKGTERIKPSNIIMAIDKNYVKTCVYRGDKLQGNIQNPDEDLVREDIIGECTQEVTYEKNHAVIIVDLI